MIEIDGSEGEGGGQILRSALSLSICTQQPFRITNIRANREKPGLLPQHLTAVRAAAEICSADVEGDQPRSRELTFHPREIKAGSYSFAIGTAGSSTLVLQTVLPPLLLARGESRVRISGGTHNKGSPPFDFLERSFVPLLTRMGAHIGLALERYGFYPRGGGEIRVSVVGVDRLKPLDIHERGTCVRAFAESYVAALPLNIAHRELQVVRDQLRWSDDQVFVRTLSNDMGPGNAVTITLEHEHVTEVITGFGERHVRAEVVASEAAHAARAYLNSTAPIGEHLADQLLLPLALAGRGAFTATTNSQHLRSNALVVRTFTGKHVEITPVSEGHRVTVS